MRTPHRLTVALATTLWAAACGVAFWLPVQTWLLPFAERLPDNRYVQGVLTAAFGVGAFAFFNWAAKAFPFWRALLTAQDRGHLWIGCVLGVFAGLTFGAIAAFVVLEPDLTAPVKSPRAMAVMWSVVVLCTFAGSFVAALSLPRPVRATPPELEPSVGSTA
jgi:hypothetical protein